MPVPCKLASVSRRVNAVVSFKNLIASQHVNRILYRGIKVEKKEKIVNAVNCLLQKKNWHTPAR